jgi:hypothetical protein
MRTRAQTLKKFLHQAVPFRRLGPKIVRKQTTHYYSWLANTHPPPTDPPISSPLSISMHTAFLPLRFFLTVAFAGLGLGWISSGLAATTLIDLHLQGTANQVENGAELTITSGGALTGATGSVVDLFQATVALPDSLSLKDLKLAGIGNQLQDGATLTLVSGATFTAATGSTVNLAAATVAFPTTVVLTTVAQTLTGKTLVSPVISSLSAAPTTDLTLAGGSGGITLTLGQGASGTATFSGPMAASNLSIASAKVFTVSNSLTLTATDSSTLNIGTGGTLRSGAYTDVGTNVRLYGAVGDGVTDDAPAIAAAITAAGPHGLVLFPAGDYAVSTNRVLLRPLKGQTLRFIDGATLRMIPVGNNDGGGLIDIVADDVTIDGAIFAGHPSLQGTIAVGVTNAKRVTIIRCTGSSLLARLAIFASGSHYGRVINCRSPGTGPTGFASNHLEFNDSNYGLVEGNTFQGIGGNGCEIYQNSNRQIYGTRVVNNVFEDIGAAGVNMFASVGAIISGNVFRQTVGHGVLITNGEVNPALLSYGNIIENNFFENCGTNSNINIGTTVPIFIGGPRNQVRNNSIITPNQGLALGFSAIQLNSGDDNSITGNFISGGRHGILVNTGVIRPTVSNNTIVDVGTSGIQEAYGIVVLGSDGQFRSNTISDTRQAGQRGIFAGAFATDETHGNIFHGNNYINTLFGLFDPGARNTRDGQLVSTATGGQAPLVVSSTTKVANLNAALLDGATFSSPGAIGNTDPATGAFTSLTANNLSINLISARTSDGLTLSGADSGASIKLDSGVNSGLTVTSLGTGRVLGLLSGASTWSINPGAGLIIPNFVLGASGGKAIALVAGPSGSGVVWDQTGFFDFAIDTRGRLVGGSTTGGTSVARLTTNFLIGGTSDISGSGGVKIFGSTASISSSTGALQVIGGAGIGGSIHVGGAASFGGSITLPGGAFVSGSNGAVSLSASGTNQNITVNPSGSGLLATSAPFTAAGAISTTATTASTSTTTGALVVAGGVGVAGAGYFGNGLSVVGTSVPALRLDNTSGTSKTTAVEYQASGTTGYYVGVDVQSTNTLDYGIWRAGNGYAFRVQDGSYTATPTLDINPRVASVNATTVSTSATTGALVVAGGFGLAGDQYLGGSLNFSGAGVLTSGGSLALSAGGTNQNITLTPSGTGSVTLAGPVSVAGNQTVSGSLTLSGGASIAGNTGALTLAAAGTHQNITLTPSGTGSIVMTGPVTFSGNQTFAGALTLSGGGALAGTAGSVDITAGGTNRNVTLTPSGTGGVAVAGPLSVTGNQTLAGVLALAGGGTLGGASGALTLGAAGTNQNVTLAPSGTGTVAITGPVTATGALAVSATAPSTSTATGALVVAGGFGLAGNQFLGGSLNLPGGGSLAGATGSLTLAAGGTNQNIALTPSGTGGVVLTGPLTTAGQVTLTSTADSTSTGTGALVISGGAAIRKKTSLGDDLVLTPTASTAATVRLSGTAITDVPGLWFRDGGSPTAANVTLSSSAFTTIVNGPPSGSLSLRVGNTNYLTLNATSATLQTIPLRVISSSASTSTTTGSGTFAGGIGVSGRTSTGSLSVGAGPTVNAILSVATTLDFPSVSPNGGVQDLTVAVSGATLGNDVSIVEAGGSFVEAGLVVRGIVSATGTVTVRATNVTTAAINPAALSFRVTVTKF